MIIQAPAQAQGQDNATRPTTVSPIIPTGSEMVKSKDPLAVYRASGIDGEQERQIRKFAKDFEDQQKVRLKLMGNLLKEMRAIELMADPDEKKAMSKQGEINKVYAEICNERIKLLLRIRNVLTFEQKERLVKNIQKTQDGN
jgi:Spy/CpxP family protein refolding chaperone